MNIIRLGFLLSVSLAATPVSAGESTIEGLADKTAGIECMPAKDFVKILKKLDDLDENKKDTVTMTPVMSFKIHDGGVYPQRVFFRHNTLETPFDLNAEGIVTDFTKIKDMSKKGDMCMQDKTRINQAEDVDGLDLNITMDLLYKNKTGLYSLSELQDGLKDGRSHIKKIVPAPIRILIPKFTHLAVSADEGVRVKIEAVKDGANISGLIINQLDGVEIIDFSQLAALGAEYLKISGGDFTLEPMPSPDKIKEMKDED